MLGFGEQKNGAPRGAGPVDTLIGAAVIVRGELHFSGGLYLEGQLLGTAQAEDGADATITIAPRGRVEGELRAPVVIIHGTVVGDVHASERLELGPTAKVEGRVHYRVVQMAAGATVTGELVHRPATVDAPASAGKTRPTVKAQGEATPA